jgi:hypothetical protein
MHLSQKVDAEGEVWDNWGDQVFSFENISIRMVVLS